MLTVDNTVFILVDLQVKLARVMQDRERLIENVCKLVRGMQVLGVPTLWAEQNPDGLGPTVPEVAEIMPGEPVTKFSFSCGGEPRFIEALDKLDRRQALVAGIETHVCVYQTVRDLLAAGCEVEVVGDAVSARTLENKAIGLEKMRGAGAAVTTVETALFELLKSADGPAFKDILRIVK